MIRVALCDDHPLVRRGMVQIISETSGISVVGEAENYADLTRVLREHECDVLVLDIEMPGKNGIEVLKQMRALYPKLRVLMLSMHPEDQYALRAMKAGASGYLTKKSAPDLLVEAVRVIHGGKKFITPELAELLATRLDQDVDTPAHELLSDREFQTLKLIASGKTLSEIAETLALSPKTVSVYRARVLEKMKLGTNAELTHYAIKNGLVD